MILINLVILIVVMFVMIANAESLTESEALANQKGAHYLCEDTHTHMNIHETTLFQFFIANHQKQCTFVF